MNLDIAHVQGDGKRHYQQDFFALSDASVEAIKAKGFDLVLADGMGGARDGALIARETVDLLHDRMAAGADGKEVLAAIEEANANIYQRYHESGGTTLIVARLTEGYLWFASVGDSNIYLRRAGRLFELNRRHEYLHDLYERALDGLLSIEEAQDNVQAKALASFIGSGALRIDHSQALFPLQTGDVLLVCSDGISDSLTTAQLLEATAHPAQHCSVLLGDMIEEAACPSQDNFTAIVVRYE